MIAFLAITGWLTAAFLALLLYGARKANHGWRKLYEEKRDALNALEHKHLVAEMDQGLLEWYRDEATRLTLKCDAICRQVRHMKGRGKFTGQIDPKHNF